MARYPPPSTVHRVKPGQPSIPIPTPGLRPPIPVLDWEITTTAVTRTTTRERGATPPTPRCGGTSATCLTARRPPAGPPLRPTMTMMTCPCFRLMTTHPRSLVTRPPTTMTPPRMTMMVGDSLMEEGSLTACLISRAARFQFSAELSCVSGGGGGQT